MRVLEGMWRRTATQRSGDTGIPQAAEPVRVELALRVQIQARWSHGSAYHPNRRAQMGLQKDEGLELEEPRGRQGRPQYEGMDQVMRQMQDGLALRAVRHVRLQDARQEFLGCLDGAFGTPMLEVCGAQSIFSSPLRRMPEHLPMCIGHEHQRGTVRFAQLQHGTLRAMTITEHQDRFPIDNA